MENDKEAEGALELFSEGPPPSKETPIPRWLLWSYLLLPIWGIITLFLFWNGSWGWLDRGYWQQLQQAADTTFVEQKKEVQSPS